MFLSSACTDGIDDADTGMGISEFWDSAEAVFTNDLETSLGDVAGAFAAGRGANLAARCWIVFVKGWFGRRRSFGQRDTRRA